MSLLQSYPIRIESMQSITQIKFFRVRLAFVCLAAYWLVIFGGTHLPSASLIHVPANDKVKHFVAFFGLTLMMCYVSSWRQTGQRFIVIAVIVEMYAAIDEWTQRFIPGRTPDRLDFVADTLGMWTAIVLYLLIRQKFRKPLNAWLRNMKTDKTKFNHEQG